MSYDIKLFHPSVKGGVEKGLRLDDFEYAAIEANVMQAFLDRLQQYGYQPEAETPQRKAFVKLAEGCPVQVGVYQTVISFSVPYWKNCERAIFEALQDASEMCDSGKLVVFNPQTDEWNSDD